MTRGAEFLSRENSLEKYYSSRVMGKTVFFNMHKLPKDCLFKYFHGKILAEGLLNLW